MFTSNSASHELCTKLIQAVHQLGFNTQLVRLLKGLVTTVLSTTRAETHPALQELDRTPISTTSADSTRPDTTTSARQMLRHGQLHKSWSQPHAAVTPIIVVTTIPRYVQRPTHQRPVQRELTKALAMKTRLHQAQEGPLLNQRKGHAEVLVRCGNKSHEDVECLLVSCMLQ